MKYVINFLFLFVVMMLNLNQQNTLEKDTWVKFACVIGGGALMLALTASIRTAELTTLSVTPLSNQGTVQSIGKELFSTHLLPFEISSILLFAAIVGAILLAKKEID